MSSPADCSKQPKALLLGSAFIHHLTCRSACASSSHYYKMISTCLYGGSLTCLSSAVPEAMLTAKAVLAGGVSLCLSARQASAHLCTQTHWSVTMSLQRIDFVPHMSTFETRLASEADHNTAAVMALFCYSAFMKISACMTASPTGQVSQSNTALTNHFHLGTTLIQIRAAELTACPTAHM